MILLAEITTYNPATSADVVTRVASEPYGDPTAPAFAHDAFAAGTPASFLTREIFADGAVFGAGSADYGDLRIKNESGWLDELASHYSDGRPVALLLGEGDYATFTPVFTGTATAVEVGVDEVRVRLRDRFADVLQQPLSADVYAGTGGAEGPAEMEGQPVTVVYGTAIGVRCDEVDAATQLYCVCDRGPVTLSDVRVRGQIITAGTARASLAALQSTAPTAGTYDWFAGSSSGRAYLRFGSNVDGEVTATVSTGSTSADRTAGQLAAAILSERAGETLAAGDVTALDTATAAEIGGAWAGTATIQQALDSIAQTVGAGYWLDPTGTWRIKRIEAPSGTPVVKFARLGLDRPGRTDEGEIIGLQPLFTTRADGGLPPWKVVIRFARNHTPQDRNAVAAAATDKERLATEWLTAVVEDGALQTRHPMSVPLELDTLFVSRADAEAEAARRQALLTGRRRYAVRVKLTAAVAAALDLGVVASIEHDRLGLSAGRTVLVLGYSLDLLAQTADLTVWG